MRARCLPHRLARAHDCAARAPQGVCEGGRAGGAAGASHRRGRRHSSPRRSRTARSASRPEATPTTSPARGRPGPSRFGPDLRTSAAGHAKGSRRPVLLMPPLWSSRGPFRPRTRRAGRRAAAVAADPVAGPECSCPCALSRQPPPPPHPSTPRAYSLARARARMDGGGGEALCACAHTAPGKGDDDQRNPDTFRPFRRRTPPVGLAHPSLIATAARNRLF